MNDLCNSDLTTTCWQATTVKCFATSNFLLDRAHYPVQTRAVKALYRDRRVKNLILPALALLLASPAMAQDFPAAELGIGYSTIDVIKGERQTANGGNGSIAFDFNRWLGAVGDLGVYSASPSLTAITYTAGPRLSYRHWSRLIPFAQLLFGGAHASSSASGYAGATNAYAFGAGGGTDFVLDHSGRFVLRPQVEYFGFGTIGSMTDTVRVSVGIVFRIPRRQHWVKSE
jgi:hypothetical protein